MGSVAERFGFNSRSREGFRQLIDAIDEKLILVATDLANRLPREVILFWFKKIKVETLLAWWLLFCKYGDVAEFELEKDGGDDTIYFQHDLGDKWSIYYKCYSETVLRNLLGISGVFEHTKSWLIVRFRLP